MIGHFLQEVLDHLFIISTNNSWAPAICFTLVPLDLL